MADNKSSTIYLQLEAEFEWAKVFPENMDKTGPNEAYTGHDGAYTIDLILSTGEYAKLERAGSQKTGSLKAKDGRWLGEKQWKSKEQGISFVDALEDAEQIKIKVIRKHTAPYTYGGAPQVAHIDGTPWDLRDDGLIGNGSKGIAYLSVYEAKGLMGTRLDGIQVMEHVAYESEGYDDATPGLHIPDRTKDRQATSAKTSQPDEKPAAKPAKKPARALVDDEIPFDSR